MDQKYNLATNKAQQTAKSLDNLNSFVNAIRPFADSMTDEELSSSLKKYKKLKAENPLMDDKVLLKESLGDWLNAGNKFWDIDFSSPRVSKQIEHNFNLAKDKTKALKKSETDKNTGFAIIPGTIYSSGAPGIKYDPLAKAADEFMNSAETVMQSKTPEEYEQTAVKSGLSDVWNEVSNRHIQDYATLGLNEAGRLSLVAQIAKKKSDGETLSESEDLVLNSYKNYLDALQYQANNGGAGWGSKLGQVISYLPDFMGGMALGNAMFSGSKLLAKKAGEGLAKRALKTATKDLIQSTATAPLTSGTWINTSNRLLNNYDIQSDNVYKIGDVSFMEALARGLGSQTAELYSEKIGDWFGNIGQVLKNGTGTLGKVANKIPKGKIANAIGKTYKAISQHGIITENIEEQINNLIEPIFSGEPERIKENFTKENILETIALTTAVSGMFSAGRLAGNASDRIAAQVYQTKAKNNLNKIQDPNVRQALSDAIISGSNIESTVNNIRKVISTNDFTPQELKSVAGFLSNSLARDIHISSDLSNELQSQKQSWTDMINEEYRRTRNIFTGNISIATDKNGTTYNVIGISNGIDGNILVRNIETGEESFIPQNELTVQSEITANDFFSQAEANIDAEAERIEQEEMAAITDANVQDMGVNTPVLSSESNLTEEQSTDFINSDVELSDGRIGHVLDVNPDGTVIMAFDNGEEGYTETVPYSSIKGLQQQEADFTSGDMMQENSVPDTGNILSEINDSALSRIPKDEQGNPIYEQTDADTAWDAIMEQTEGDEVMAQTVADGMVADKEAELKKIEKAKAKTGVSIAEKIAAERERKNAVEKAKANLAHWQKIAQTAQRRKQTELEERRRISKQEETLRKAEEERLRAEQEESERIEREALHDIPNRIDDTSNMTTANLSVEETDEFGKPLVLAKDGTTTFGIIDRQSGLTEAPIHLSLGENTIDEKGKNRGYGLLHIEAEHGEQIRNAGYESVESFIEEVAKNYTDIREGAKIGENQTYLLEVADERNNTLFIQLSKDGSYWNVNSAGILRKTYSRRKPKVYAIPAVEGGTVTDTPEVNSGQTEGATAPAGNSPKTSFSKGNEKAKTAQVSEEKTWQPHILPGKLMEAYESGNEALISFVEQKMRDFINGADNMKLVYVTFLKSKDIERQMRKGSPSNKTQHFIAETCKDVLKKAGLPTKAMQSQRARTEIAGSTTDPHVLDIMSVDPSSNVLNAIINNHNVNNATLENIAGNTNDSYLKEEARKVLDTRKEVYSRHTTTKQPAETVEASQKAEQNGTQTSSSMNAPTTSSKGNENLPFSSEWYLTETPIQEGPDLVPTSDSSVSINKGTINSQKDNESDEKISSAESIANTEPDKTPAKQGSEDKLLFRDEVVYTPEEQNIINTAKTNGTYMKAPNGKPSNLNEKQWVQVRTKAFKKWFGDWEKTAQIEKLRKSEPVEITGEEIVPSDDLKEYKKNALEYGKKLRGEYINKDTGDKIAINAQSLKEVLHHDYKNEEQLQSVAAIPQIIENGVYIDTVENESQDPNSKVREYRYYVCGLKIGGEDYTVKAAVAVDNNGNRYYDHALTRIEKTKLLEELDGITSPSSHQAVNAETSINVSGIKDKRLLSILQTNSSKVVDENGEPKVFYHNTDAEFTTFDEELNGTHTDAGWLGDGFYFYGDENEGGGYGKNKMKVFLNVRNFYYATSEENDRLAELNDRDASIEFREEVESEGYDGVYYNGDLRQEAVVFSPNQIKSATDNTGAFSTENDNILFREVNGDSDTSFSISKPVEQNGNLVALHNLSEEKLRQALDLGGFPMPSIAITNAGIGHTEFGEISLLFDKNTIDPSDRRNKVYSGDAWTPTFPSVGYKLNEEKTSDIYTRANKAGRLPLFNPVYFHPDNYKRHIKGLNSDSLVKHFKDDYDAKQFYLSETGHAVDKWEEHEVDKYLPDQVALYKDILEKIGLERLKKEEYDVLKEEVKSILGNHYNVDFESMPLFRLQRRIKNTIQKTLDYAENGNKKTENDIEATKKKIDEKIAPKKFEKWLEDLFAGVVEKEGIRNDKDAFTASGSSRKWESLYDEVTLDNVVKAMQRQADKGGSGLFGGNIFGASTKEFKNIDDIRHEAKQRIQSISENEYQAEKDRITARLDNINVPSASKSFSDTLDFVENVKDAVAKSHTPKGIYNYLRRFYPDMTMNVAEEIADIVKDIQNMATLYFEAKPYRAIGFDEVRLAVVPSDTNADIIKQLESKGIQVRTYEKGNTEQRKQIVADTARENNLLFRKGVSIEDVNRRFNDELKQQIEGTLPAGHIYQLGMPSEKLLSAGIPDLPIELAASRLSNKSMQENHPFELSEIKNLPHAIQNPMAIFRSATHIGSYVVMTEIEHNGKNFVVAIKANRKKGKIEINDIRSIHYRTSNAHIANWITEGLLEYADKERMAEWFSKQRYNSAEVRKLFNHAANIVKNFENQNFSDKYFRDNRDYIESEPSTSLQAIRSTIDHLSQTFNTPVITVQSVSELPEDIRSKVRNRKPSGLFNETTGQVYLVLDNIVSDRDAQATFFHEVVAHKGMDGLLGDKYPAFLSDVFESMDSEMQEQMMNRYGDRQTAAKEYIAQIAEGDIYIPAWRRVLSRIRNFFRRIGLPLKITDGDIRLMLLKSVNRLKNGNFVQTVNRIAEEQKLEKELQVQETFDDIVEKSQSIEQFMDNVDKNRNILLRDRKYSDEINYGRSDEKRTINRSKVLDQKRRSVNRQLERFEKAFMDSGLVVKKLLNDIRTQGGTVTEKSDIYRQMDKVASKTQQSIEAYYKNYMLPVLDSVSDIAKKYDMSKQDVEDYLMAKHAKERTDSGINAIGEEGSGWDKNIVDAIIQEFENKVSETERKDLWSKINKATGQILNKAVASGRMSYQDKREIDQKKWKYYVPLRGWAESNQDNSIDQDYIDLLPPKETWKNARRSVANIRAKGRISKPANALSNIMSIAEQEIRLGELNRLYQGAYKLVKDNSDRTDLFTVREQWYFRSGSVDIPMDRELTPEEIDRNTQAALIVDKLDRLIQEKTAEFEEEKDEQRKTELQEELSTLEKDRKEADRKVLYTRKSSRVRVNTGQKNTEIDKLRQHELTVMINGLPFTITFADEAVRNAIMGNNLKGFNNPVTQTTSGVTRYLSNVFTSKNPEFILSNFARDMQHALIYNLTDAKGNAVLFMQNIPAGMATTARGVYGKANPLTVSEIGNANLENAADRSELTKRYGQDRVLDTMYQIFISEGGTTGFVHMLNSEKYETKFSKDIQRSIKGRGFIRSGLKTIGNGLDNLAEVSENATRFTTFLTQMEAGNSIFESVDYAKNITVNFNRKGELTGYFSPLFAFFNASFRGLANDLELYRKNKKAFATIMVIRAAAGFIISMMLDSLLGNDDEATEIKDATRFSNIIIPITKDKYLKIPLPVSGKFPHTIGSLMYDVAVGKRKPKDAAKVAINAAFDSYSPLGSPVGDPLRPFVPTLAVPIYDIAVNENAFGYPIHRENYTRKDDKLVPQHQLALRNVNKFLYNLSVGLNRLGGGDENTPAGMTQNGEENAIKKILFDWNPSDVEHVIEYYTGGTGRFLNNVLKTVIPIFDHEQEQELYTIPIVNRFLGEVSEKNVTGTFYDIADRIDNLNAIYKRNIRDGNYNSSWADNMSEYKKQANDIALISKRLSITEEKIKHYRENMYKYEKGEDNYLKYKGKIEDEINAFINYYTDKKNDN